MKKGTNKTIATHAGPTSTTGVNTSPEFKGIKTTTSPKAAHTTSNAPDLPPKT
jgi:hypothetical protein